MIEAIRGHIYVGQLRQVWGTHTLSMMNVHEVSVFRPKLMELPIGDKFLVESINHNPPHAAVVILTLRGERGRVYNSELNAYTRVVND